MTIDDIKDMNVGRFCAVIKTAFEAEIITGKEALELIKLYYEEIVK